MKVTGKPTKFLNPARRLMSAVARRAVGGSYERARRTIPPQWACRMFYEQLVRKTNNFGTLKWLGNPIWQNTFDLWIIQETLAEVKPALLIETGTNRGGSALFYAHLFDLMDNGRIITVDVEKLHSLNHPRIQFIQSSSTDPKTVAAISTAAKGAAGPVMVILDSDHSEAHVAAEMECYASLVTPGSYMLVQDGVMDVLPMLRGPGPGPLPAIEKFLPRHPEFKLDSDRCERFLITHHPKGWLQRVA
jgi:cephalosporin hydroxylase